MSGESPEPNETVCPLCAVGCHLERAPDRSRAKGRASPANPGGRLCAKGVRAFDSFDGDRLTRPLVRRDGEQVPASWATAYDAAVAGFESVLAAHGPGALAFLGAPRCTNEENYLLQKLARTLGTNDVDNRARRCHVSATRALSRRVGWPASTNGLDDLGEADLVLVAGANPAERQPIAFNSFVRPAVNAGTTLVHVDPAGNRTTRLADVHLAPRPGTDALVFDLLSAHVLDAGGADREFVADRTRGYDEFAARLADLDPDRALSLAGVDRDEIARVGDRLAGAGRAAAMVGTGVEGGDGEADAAEALLDLLLLTGNLGRPGTGLFVLRGLANEQGATDAGCVPDRLPGHRPVTDPEARARVADEWGFSPPSNPGKTARELLAGFGDGIRAALVVGENPAVSKRDSAWVRRRLDALDALVVLDVAPNETTASADVVLPAAAGVEKAGTVTNLDRRVQRLRPTAQPPGDARPDFAVLRDLGRRLADDPARFDYGGVGEAFDELSRVAPTYAGVSYADLDDGRRWPFDRDSVLYREAFETTDGRAPFGPPRSLVEPVTGDGLHLVTGGRASDLHDDREVAGRSLRIHPDDAAERGLGDDCPVRVSGEGATVEATAELDGDVRRGTVYLHAAVADPLVRSGAGTVEVESLS